MRHDRAVPMIHSLALVHGVTLRWPPDRRYLVLRRRWLAVLMVLPSVAACTGSSGGGHHRDRVAETTHPLPALWPAAQQVVRHAVDVPVPSMVAVVTGKAADRPAVEVATSTLRGLGARKVTVAADPPRSAALTVYVGGPAENARTAAALGQLKAAGTGGLPAEGYVLASGRNGDGGTVVLAGADPDGTFHAAQTLHQLAAGGFLPGVVLRDWPAM